VLVTLHRPALVDGPLLQEAVRQLAALAAEMPVVFPAHPRTQKNMNSLGAGGSPGFQIIDPLGYLEFLNLLSGAAAVLTDSGGIQEEATFLGIPCLTLRDNTERPVTVEMGTNALLGLRPDRVGELPSLIDEIRARETKVPPLWDGGAAQRIVQALLERR
ncbi:MAG TPA: UDP-N-acetylglucosamine 2-epimerase, partial [Vicinamibacterales bacterium]|nr:UDP-N-acetylglucosamine 2-epimerase [Vicinamibacterales bacterium]